MRESPNNDRKQKDSFPPCYHGNDRFFSLIFAPEDAEAGRRAIRGYNERGYHLWYNEELSRGVHWSGEISRAVELCDVLILLLSEDSFGSRSFSYARQFRTKLKKRLLLIHLDDTRWHNPDADPMLELQAWADPNAPDFEKACDDWHLHSYRELCGKTAEPQEPIYDYGVLPILTEEDPAGVHLFNLRTHEAWNKEKAFLKILSDREIDAYRKNGALICRLIGKSYTRDYVPGSADEEYAAEIRHQKEEAKRKAEEKARKEAREREERQKNVWADYPYMDEFEYIDSLFSGDDD